MVNTRSQVRSSIPVYMSGMDKHDRSSDTESECSVTEVLSRDQIDELDDGNLIRTNNNSEQIPIDQRFSDMNKQISDLTGLVLASIEKLSSNNGEGNSQSTASDKACARSDTWSACFNCEAARVLREAQVTVMLRQQREATERGRRCAGRNVQEKGC